MSTAHRQGDGPSRVGSSRDREGGASVSRKKTGSSGHRDDAKMIGQWRIGRTIGKGSSGRVKIAKHAITGKYAAIKIVPKGLILTSRMSVSEAGARADKVMLGIEREIVIMKLIDHPNVLNLYDVWETSSELYLIMEYVPGGELFDYLVKRGRLPVSEALHYFQQIIHAVDYCHRFNICHRDLKPENLLLDKDKNIKVADFGMAAWEAGERMLETSCGSPHYASPEIVAGKAYHGSSSDIWSCGIILFALLTGRLPFDDDNIRSLLQKVKVGVFEMPDEIKDPARDLLRRMLEKDPERRITMPEILQHPFFVSRPPRAIPGRQFVSPPSLDEVERPVNSPEEIDADIMGNLKTLWSGASDDEIVAALMSKEKTWEKAIYHLLVKYRNKHLENYNMDDEEDAEARARRQARREREGRSAPSPAKRKGGPPAPIGAPRLTPLSENETIQDRAPSPVARPSAPTPKKAAGSGEHENSSPDSKLPKQLAPPRGPRPPAPQRSSYASSNDSHMTPSIVLQEATPTKDLVYSAVQPRPRSMEPPSPSIPSTPQMGASPLNVPLVQDEQLQHFFNEVANQLNTMNIRSSVASGSSTSTSAALGTDYHAYMAYLNHPGSTSNPVSPVIEAAEGELDMETVDPNQFADADDDETELASVYSHHAPSSIIHVNPQSSPLVGLGFGQPPAMTRPGLYPAGHAGSAAQNPNRWSYASSAGSSRVPAESPSPQLYSPGPWSPHPEPTPMMAHRAAPAPPPRAHRPAPPPPRPVSTVSTGESLLKRDESYVVIDGSDVPASDSSWGSKQSGFSAHRGTHDAFGMLKKRKKAVTIDPVPYSSDLGGPSTAASAFSNFSTASSSTATTSSPKRSWFNNLFSFKPASCTLLSHDNVANTRDRVRCALMDIGVRVAVAEIEGVRGLKCRLDEVRDPTQGGTVVKGVRFKVEFARSNAGGGGGGGYNTLVSLTQEKGAQSSFKGIFNSLKSVIESTTTPRSPQPASAPSSLGGRYHPRPNPPVHASSYAPSTAVGVSGVTMHRAQDTLAAPPVRWAHSAPNSPIMPSTPRFTPSPQMHASTQLPTAIRM